MQHDLAGLAQGLGLKSNSQPAVGFVRAGHVASPPSRGALCLIRNLYFRVRWTAIADGRSILPIQRPAGDSSEIHPPPSMAARFNASELLICRPQWSISRWRAKARGNPYATIT